MLHRTELFPKRTLKVVWRPDHLLLKTQPLLNSHSLEAHTIRHLWIGWMRGTGPRPCLRITRRPLGPDIQRHQVVAHREDSFPLRLPELRALHQLSSGQYGIRGKDQDQDHTQTLTQATPNNTLHRRILHLHLIARATPLLQLNPMDIRTPTDRVLHLYLSVRHPGTNAQNGATTVAVPQTQARQSRHSRRRTRFLRCRMRARLSEDKSCSRYLKSTYLLYESRVQS